MIVRAPKYFKGGRVVEDMIQNMDIGPALLAMAGVEIDPNMQAETVLPVLKGEAWNGRKAVFAEQVKDKNFTEADYMSMVRTEEWKLVHFIGEADGQLFNLKNGNFCDYIKQFGDGNKCLLKNTNNYSNFLVSLNKINNTVAVFVIFIQ